MTHDARENGLVWPQMPFRLWKSALKDDESLIDEAIAATYDRMIPIDPVRAEHVMSLIIRRHADAKNALKDLLSQQAAFLSQLQ